MQTTKDILHDAEVKMKKAIEVCREEFARIRSGKATSALLDGVKVEYYGTMTPLRQIANVSTPDVHTISVQPYDKSGLAAIEKAVLTANLGFNPVNDGNVIRIPIPPLTEERRKELVKIVKQLAENQKIAVRNVRRDANEHLKKLLKGEHISEDDVKRSEQETQKLTDKYIKEIDSLVVLKEKEIMEV